AGGERLEELFRDVNVGLAHRILPFSLAERYPATNNIAVAMAPPPTQASATSAPGTCRSPHSPRSCSTASASLPKPWSRPPPRCPPSVHTGTSPPSRPRPSANHGPASPFFTNPRSSSQHSVIVEKPA